MTEFTVGKQFPLPPVTQEGATFSVEPFTMMLIYRFDTPTEAEIKEFKDGEVQLAVTELKNVLFIASKFGHLNWSDCPYSTQLSEREKILPELGEGHLGYSLDAFLVDSKTNILIAHRLVRMERSFSEKLRVLLIDDSRKAFDDATYEKSVQEVYRNYPTRELVKLAFLHMKEKLPEKKAPATPAAEPQAPSAKAPAAEAPSALEETPDE